MWRFFFGLIMGAGVMRLIIWAQSRHMVVNWYVWLMGALAFFLATLAVQHFFGSIDESEPRAAWRGAVFMGILSLVLSGATLWFFLKP